MREPVRLRRLSDLRSCLRGLNLTRVTQALTSTPTSRKRTLYRHLLELFVTYRLYHQHVAVRVFRLCGVRSLELRHPTEKLQTCLIDGYPTCAYTCRWPQRPMASIGSTGVQGTGRYYSADITNVHSLHAKRVVLERQSPIAPSLRLNMGNSHTEDHMGTTWRP